MNLISGERFQDMADIYLGCIEDFKYNPAIAVQKHKHKNISEITRFYDNPKIIFCYSHRIAELAAVIPYFQNKFILITHNSDLNISEEKLLIISKIVQYDKVMKWFAQNLCLTEYNKLHFLPIGMANQQWEHGTKFKYFYEELYLSNEMAYKQKKVERSVYFFFLFSTNVAKRQLCYDALRQKIPFLTKISPLDNFKRLCEYQFCICPEGNGVDTHRFWEALYLKCVPIVVQNPFIDIIKKTTTIPMLVLNSWNDFNSDTLPDYASFDFQGSAKYLDLNFYRDMINN